MFLTFRFTWKGSEQVNRSNALERAITPSPTGPGSWWTSSRHLDLVQPAAPVRAVWVGQAYLALSSSSRLRLASLWVSFTRTEMEGFEHANVKPFKPSCNCVTNTGILSDTSCLFLTWGVAFFSNKSFLWSHAFQNPRSHCTSHLLPTHSSPVEAHSSHLRIARRKCAC